MHTINLYLGLLASILCTRYFWTRTLNIAKSGKASFPLDIRSVVSGGARQAVRRETPFSYHAILAFHVLFSAIIALITAVFFVSVLSNLIAAVLSLRR